MALCLLNRDVGPVPDIYDHRYFYIDANGGHCVSGLARNAMARFLREYNSGMFLEQHWFTSLMDTKNPSMQGFIVEQLILSTISLIEFNGYKLSKMIILAIQIFLRLNGNIKKRFICLCHSIFEPSMLFL